MSKLLRAAVQTETYLLKRRSHRFLMISRRAQGEVLSSSPSHLLTSFLRNSSPLQLQASFIKFVLVSGEIKVLLPLYQDRIASRHHLDLIYDCLTQKSLNTNPSKNTRRPKDRKTNRPKASRHTNSIERVPNKIITASRHQTTPANTTLLDLIQQTVKMPPPALVPVLSFDHPAHPISHLTLTLDATILRSWHDTSPYGLSDPKHPYYAVELLISSFPSPHNRVLARYSGSRLKRDALYQLKGRFYMSDLLDSNGNSNSYLHIDEAVRFQGPGTIKSFRPPRFVLVAEVLEVGRGREEGYAGDRVEVRWMTRDPYRRDMVYEQSCTLSLEESGKARREREGNGDVVGELCYLEGRMNGLDYRQLDWACTGIKIC
ncbi:hypothetical protein V8E51_002144 [Hyaloscypha variabilis]|jgi:hypothetical protein